ncbi:MAG: TetR/AcrR family transcriptional regulator [Mycobacteriales bacterium]
MAGDPEVRIDRRQRKTRAALHRALLDLIAVRPYDAITVDDIVTSAAVARATFYAHYRDKGDLLAAMSDNLITELMATVGDVSWQQPPAFSGAGIHTILIHVDRHRDLYRLLLGGGGGVEPRAALIDAFRSTADRVFSPVMTAHGKSPRAGFPLVTTTFVGALLLTIERWLGGELTGDIDSLSVEFMQVAAGGLGWSLGFEPGDLHYEPTIRAT